MSLNILVVDDSHSMRSVIRKVVSMSGFEINQCYEAGNGSEALALMADRWVDLVISDVNMPEMNGIELLQSMQADELLRTIPVVMVTTEGNEERMKEAFDSGARAYLRKPFLPEECRNMLVDVMGIDEDGTYESGNEDIENLDF